MMRDRLYNDDGRVCVWNIMKRVSWLCTTQTTFNVFVKQNINNDFNFQSYAYVNIQYEIKTKILVPSLQTNFIPTGNNLDNLLYFRFCNEYCEHGFVVVNQYCSQLIGFSLDSMQNL